VLCGFAPVWTRTAFFQEMIGERFEWARCRDGVPSDKPLLGQIGREDRHAWWGLWRDDNASKRETRAAAGNLQWLHRMKGNIVEVSCRCSCVRYSVRIGTYRWWCRPRTGQLCTHVVTAVRFPPRMGASATALPSLMARLDTVGWSIHLVSRQ